MGRFAFALLVGIVGAGIVHIAILFMLPALSERDAWSTLSRTLQPYQVTMVHENEAAHATARRLDPLFHGALCIFNLGDGPLHLTAEGDVPFWSMSIYDTRGQNIFSLNDRTAPGAVFDIVVLSPLQMIELRNDPVDLGDTLFVETEARQGIVLIRAFAPEQSWDAAVRNYLGSVGCEAV